MDSMDHSIWITAKKMIIILFAKRIYFSTALLLYLSVYYVLSLESIILNLPKASSYIYQSGDPNH